MIMAPYRGLFSFMSFILFMSQLIACYQRYRHLPDGAPALLPAEIYFFWTPDQKVRMHKRGKSFRIDRWMPSFDDAADIINKIVASGYYKLRTPGYKPDPFDNALFKQAVIPHYSNRDFIRQPKKLALAP